MSGRGGLQHIGHTVVHVHLETVLAAGAIQEAGETAVCLGVVHQHAVHLCRAGAGHLHIVRAAEAAIAQMQVDVTAVGFEIDLARLVRLIHGDAVEGDVTAVCDACAQTRVAALRERELCASDAADVDAERDLVGVQAIHSQGAAIRVQAHRVELDRRGVHHVVDAVVTRLRKHQGAMWMVGAGQCHHQHSEEQRLTSAHKGETGEEEHKQCGAAQEKSTAQTSGKTGRTGRTTIGGLYIDVAIAVSIGASETSFNIVELGFGRRRDGLFDGDLRE
mmetsp:Transcript_171/g.510  ORF Transcript_171/g.510 Transcript_171/m.510 type:complete len:276 (+) Transcript_171:2230-3057(+)